MKNSIFILIFSLFSIQTFAGHIDLSKLSEVLKAVDESGHIDSIETMKVGKMLKCMPGITLIEVTGYNYSEKSSYKLEVALGGCGSIDLKDDINVSKVETIK